MSSMNNMELFKALNEEIDDDFAKESYSLIAETLAGGVFDPMEMMLALKKQSAKDRCLIVNLYLTGGTKIAKTMARIEKVVSRSGCKEEIKKNYSLIKKAIANFQSSGLKFAGYPKGELTDLTLNLNRILHCFPAHSFQRMLTSKRRQWAYKELTCDAFSVSFLCVAFFKKCSSMGYKLTIKDPKSSLSKLIDPMSLNGLFLNVEWNVTERERKSTDPHYTPLSLRDFCVRQAPFLEAGKEYIEAAFSVEWVSKILKTNPEVLNLKDKKVTILLYDPVLEEEDEESSISS